MAVRKEILFRFVERMLAATKDPSLTEALAWFGMNDTRVEEIKTMLAQCKEHALNTKAMLDRRVKANIQKRASLRMARKACGDLGFVVRSLYPQGEFRRMLNMQTRYTYVTNDGEEPEVDPDAEVSEDGVALEEGGIGTAGESGADAPGGGPENEGPEERPEPELRGVRRSVQARSTEADFRSRLTETLESLAIMPEEDQARLASFGWGPDRIALAKGHLDQYLADCEASEHADRLYRQEVIDTRMAVAELDRIYRLFSIQIRRNSEQFPTLAGYLTHISPTLKV